MIAQAEMFDPRHYQAVRRPLLDAETLPPWCYTSPDFYRREVERIFMKVWNFVGSIDQIPNPGDYFTLDFVGVPLVILRDGHGKLRAFANSCRHRGSELLSGSGNCKLIVCPYHSWTYDLAGKLRGAPEMEKTHGFDKQDYSLVPIKLDTWGGFLFINFDEKSGPLKDYLVVGRREAGGTYAPLIYPSTYLACTIDCAWYLEMHPMGPGRTRMVHGALFPKSRLERPDFDEVAKNYYHRWDVTLGEDIFASERQQKGIASPFCRSGRFSYREPLVHEIDNWILDRVLGPP